MFLISGCGVDLCINILLTLLGYIPGHIHAFYLEYVYYKRQEDHQYGAFPQNHQGLFKAIRLELIVGVYSQPQPNYGAVPRR